MSKVDLSDGFYHLWLRLEETHCLVVLLTTRKNEPALIGIPMTNPMGSLSSPPNFPACTETVANLANDNLDDGVVVADTCLRSHRLDVVSESQPVKEPSPDPGAIPSPDPSASPNPVPSFDPSLEPCTVPSSVPSPVPSAFPSQDPSSIPRPVAEIYRS